MGIEGIEPLSKAGFTPSGHSLATCIGSASHNFMPRPELRGGRGDTASGAGPFGAAIALLCNLAQIQQLTTTRLPKYPTLIGVLACAVKTRNTRILP